MWSEVSLRDHGPGLLEDKTLADESLWGAVESGEASASDALAAGGAPVLPEEVGAEPRETAPAHVPRESALEPEEIERIVSSRMEAVIRRVLEPVIAELARKVIEEVAWDVIPDLAEAMIRAEIERVRKTTLPE